MNIRRWQSYEILSAPDTITYSEADVFILPDSDYTTNYRKIL